MKRLSGMCKSGVHDGCDTYGIVRLPHGKTIKCICSCHVKSTEQEVRTISTKTLQGRAAR